MRVEAAAGQHVVADDVDLPLDPALPGRPVGGQHVDGEPVVLGERGRLRVQRHRHPRGDWRRIDGLGAVVDDACPGTPPKWANARRWQSQNVARSMLVVKQQNGSRE